MLHTTIHSSMILHVLTRFVALAPKTSHNNPNCARATELTIAIRARTYQLRREHGPPSTHHAGDSHKEHTFKANVITQCTRECTAHNKKVCTLKTLKHGNFHTQTSSAIQRDDSERGDVAPLLVIYALSMSTMLRYRRVVSCGREQTHKRQTLANRMEVTTVRLSTHVWLLQGSPANCGHCKNGCKKLPHAVLDVRCMLLRVYNAESERMRG